MDDALKQLWDGDKLILYPDYVMNDFSLMAADMLVSQPTLSQEFRDLAFKTIRSPLEFMMANKGHRVDVVFKIYRRFIDACRALDLLNTVDCEFVRYCEMGVYCTVVYLSRGYYYLQFLKRALLLGKLHRAFLS